MSFLFKKRRARGGTDSEDSSSSSSSSTASSVTATPTSPTTPNTPTSAKQQQQQQSSGEDPFASQQSQIQQQQAQLQQLMAKKKQAATATTNNNVKQQSSTSTSTTSSSSKKKKNQSSQKVVEEATEETETEEMDPLAKMYEEMYMKQTQSVVGDLDDEIDTRKLKFVSYKNPLYEGSIVDSNSNSNNNTTASVRGNDEDEDDEKEDDDYAEEPDEEELYWRRQQEEEERRKNRKLRKMNVSEVVHVPIQLPVNPRKFLSYPIDDDNDKQKNSQQQKTVQQKSKVSQAIESIGEELSDWVQKSTREAVLAATTESIVADELFETVTYALDEVMVWHMQGMEPILLEEDDWDWGCFMSGDCYIVMKTFNAQNEDERLRVIYTWMGEESNWQKRAICAFLVQELRGKLTTGMKRLRMEKQYEESAEFRDLFGGHLKYEKKSFTDESIPVRAQSEVSSSVNAPPAAGELPHLLVFSLMLVENKQEEEAQSKHKKINANRHKVVVTRIPWNKRYSKDGLSQNEQNKKSAFIVNSNDKIYVWMGSECFQPLQIKMIETAKLIMYEEHRKEGIVVIETQGSESQEFLALLPDSQSLPEYSPAMVNLDTVVHQVGLNEESKLIDVVPLKDFELNAHSFENHYCYLIETQYEVYGWMGRDTLPMERRFLKQLLTKLKQDNANVLTCAFFCGHEPVLMRERFSGYTSTETRESYEERRQNLSNISKRKLTTDSQSYFDSYSQLDIEAERQKKLIDELDDGSGTVQVWRVIDFDIAEPVPEEDIGNFHTGECYLVLYEFNRADVLYGEDEEGEDEEEEEEDEESDGDYKDYDYESQSEEEDDYEKRGLVTKSADVKKKRIAYLTRKILYCWEGAESDKKVAARILKENFHGYASDAINPAVVLTLYEGKESKHFMRVFEHIMTIHRGKSTDSRESYDSALYRIYCKTDPEDGSSYNSKAVEVVRRKSSLNSNDIFVLVSTKTAYIWVGSYAGSSNKKIAFKLAQAIITGNKRVLAIDEDQEPEEFWEDLGQISVNDKYPVDKINYERGNVFECTITSNNNFRVMDIGNVGDNILQADLTDCHYPLIFDFSDTMFIWYPLTNPDPTIRYLVRNAVYQLTLPESEESEEAEKQTPDFHEVCVAGNDKVKVYEEYRDNETANFKMVFPMWRTNRIFVDQHALDKQRDEEERSATIMQALPFLQILREKHPYLLQSDEHVNIHNTVELVKIGLGAKTNSDIVIKELCNLDLYDFNNDLDKCDDLCSDLMRFCLTGIKRRKK